MEREHEQKTTPELLTGVQGQGGAGGQPFAGSRMPRHMLKARGFEVGASTWRPSCGAWASRRCTASPTRAAACVIYPYLLRGLAIERANQVWAMDLTCIPMARGFVYLAAIID